MSYYTQKMYGVKDLDKNDFRIYDFKMFFDFGMNILEIGCSVGNFIAINPKNITGIDIDKDAIEICKKRGLKAIQMDANKGLKFNDNTFDGVYLYDTICTFSDPLFILKEIKRILKPGGKLVIRDIDTNTVKATKMLWNDYAYKRGYNKESLKRLAMDAGFSRHKEYKDVTLFLGLSFLVRKRTQFSCHIGKIQESLNLGRKIVLEAVK